MESEKNIVLFALRTCPACKKTKELLDKKNVKYISIELDTIDVESRNKMLIEVGKFNPRETFPTLVINKGEDVIVGFDEEKINRLL